MAPLALILGLIGVLTAFNYTTAIDGTVNLGYLQQQMMALHCGLAMLIIAAIRWERPGEARERVQARRDAVSHLTDEEISSRASREKKMTYGFVAALVLMILFLVVRNY